MVLIGGPKRPLPLHAKGIACNERNYDEALTRTKPAKHTESSQFYHKRLIFIHPLPTQAGIVTFRHTWRKYIDTLLKILHTFQNTGFQM